VISMKGIATVIGGRQFWTGVFDSYEKRSRKSAFWSRAAVHEAVGTRLMSWLERRRSGRALAVPESNPDRPGDQSRDGWRSRRFSVSPLASPGDGPPRLRQRPHRARFQAVAQTIQARILPSLPREPAPVNPLINLYAEARKAFGRRAPRAARTPQGPCPGQHRIELPSMSPWWATDLKYRHLPGLALFTSGARDIHHRAGGSTNGDAG
jgi:hypothetical protein